MSSRPAIASMTGFARAETREGERQWVWEARSVNGRGLEVRCRLPAGLEALEPLVRQSVARYCRRGNVAVQLDGSRQGAPQPRYRLNREALGQVLPLVRDLASERDMAPPRIDGLLALPGVIERVEEEEAEAVRAARMTLLGTSLETALGTLAAMRAAEGGRLAEIVAGQIAEIEALVGRARGLAAAQPEAQKARFRQQVQELLAGLPPLPEERLAQELALLIAKGDVREELDRLAAHLQATRALLAEGGAVGRKLDFLCQELNREANTICSKSQDLALTTVGLELKAVVEQLREQVQNIE
jgi:uncharacterized protein (TIGR00255 family)